MNLADQLEELITFTEERLERRADAAHDRLGRLGPLPERLDSAIWRWELDHGNDPLAAELRHELNAAVADLRVRLAAADAAIDEATRADSLDRLRALVKDLRISLIDDE